MNDTYITVNIVAPQPESELGRIARGSRAMAAWIERGIKNHITRERHAGNLLFAHIETHEQYLAACAANERRIRLELGFWRYHFGHRP